MPRVRGSVALIGLLAAVVVWLSPLAGSAFAADSESGATSTGGAAESPPAEQQVVPADKHAPAQSGRHDVAPMGKGRPDAGTRGVEGQTGEQSNPPGDDEVGPETSPSPQPPVEEPGDTAAPPPEGADKPEATRTHDRTSEAVPAQDTGSTPPDAVAPESAPALTVASPAPPVALPTAPVAVPLGPSNDGRRASPALSKRWPRRLNALARSWETLTPLVRSPARPVWDAPTRSWAPNLSITPERRVSSSTRVEREKSVTRDPSKIPLPGAPRIPDSSVCIGSSSCAAGFVPVLPPLAALACVCALLFERLFDAMSRSRPAAFLSPLERPG